MTRRPILVLLLACLLGGVVASCAEEEYPKDVWEAKHAHDAGIDATTPQGPVVCTQARAQSLPARLVAMSGAASGGPEVVLVSELFQRFESVCGSCHGPSVDPPGQGGFQIATVAAFTTEMDGKTLAHVTSDACPTDPSPSNALDPMPPCKSPNGGPYSKRSATDPVRQFAELVKLWLAAGSPAQFVPGGGGDAGKSGAARPNPYAMTPERGNAMTNLGDCVPNAALVGQEQNRSAELDAMFAGLRASETGTAAQMIGLPEHLSDTDLTTFDGAELARHGVVAFVPAYPLWSDDAGKLRHVRVPRGTSIHFDKATQSFDIPPNTRFYKTFMKQVVDTDGSMRYRKIETRLIVARPDRIAPDGTATPTALFGTYLWNADESDAVLVETPLNSGRPFADTLLLYNTDEQVAAAILAGNPALPEEQLLEGNAARHYAVPSSDRCIQCHMGSASKDFILGFLPVQIRRRETGAGGTMEPTAPDELTQLERLIAYGIVTGVDSVEDVALLEATQGERAPRNAYELKAQGYMLGNCAHCHNPRGLPTVQNPVLRDLFNLLPGPAGGIFQFPLDRFSPRILRGSDGTTPIPYITPSLMDLPQQNNSDLFVLSTTDGITSVALAPWRSLIYRNVDTPFSYTADTTVFPHMPMNTPGYDPRAKQIMADWMVSIPAARKHPDLPEYAFMLNATQTFGGTPDTEAQPYVEVRSGDPQYDAAVHAASVRLGNLHSGVCAELPIDEDAGGSVYIRYKDPLDTGDIQDPNVLHDPINYEIPKATRFPFEVPTHPHWVITDLSQPPGDWQPRESTWEEVLVARKTPESPRDNELEAIDLLQTAKLEDVAAFAQAKIPFGLWKQKPGCNLGSIPTVGSYSGEARPHWMDWRDTTSKPPVGPPAADAPVYSQTPGAAVFKNICINCHGPNADSNGRMAQNLAQITGGRSEVADFRHGLFGTDDQGNRNIDRVFGALPGNSPPLWQGLLADEVAARYMAWMGLGGTSAKIPQDILSVVSTTKILGSSRHFFPVSTLSANMLSLAKTACAIFLGPWTESTWNPATDGPFLGSPKLSRGLIWGNGDAEMWLRLCSLSNPPPVRVLGVAHANDPSELTAELQGPGYFVSWSTYEKSGGPVGYEGGWGDSHSKLTPNTATERGNLWPWCVDPSGADALQTAWIAAKGLPVCPTAIASEVNDCKQGRRTDCYGSVDADAWAVRGAVNAGLSVFLYLRDFIHGGGPPPPDYDQCENLSP